MQTLWRSEDVIAATGGISAAPPWVASGVSIDSRALSSGDLFIAIKGPHHDGHDFVEAAFKKGAAAALVERGERASGATIQVKDSHQALVALGRAARRRVKTAKIAAITGSVGKTGVKDGLALALAANNVFVHAALQSLNNHWGVPLALARMPADSDFGIFEIGMNHAGEITPLARLVKPDLVIITQIAEAHLAFFKTLDEIAEAKAEIFDGLKEGGGAVLNRDSAFYDFLSQRAAQKKVGRLASFGTDAQSDVRLLEMSCHQGGAEVRARVFERELAFDLFMPVRALALNALAILGAVHLLGGDVEAAAMRLGAYRPAAGRGARAKISVNGASVILIDESYNANPASMRAAFEALANHETRGRRIAVLGDMHELGDASVDLHQALLKPLLQAKVDVVFACGEQVKYLYDILPKSLRGGYAAAPEGLLNMLKTTLSAGAGGDIVMVKGSHAAGLDRIVAALKDMS